MTKSISEDWGTPELCHTNYHDVVSFSSFSPWMNCNRFLTTTHQNTPENKLTQYDTHNPRFTVLEGAVWKEPQVPCPRVKESDRWTGSSTFSARAIHVVDAERKTFKKKKKKKSSRREKRYVQEKKWSFTSSATSYMSDSSSQLLWEAE